MWLQLVPILGPIVAGIPAFLVALRLVARERGNNRKLKALAGEAISENDAVGSGSATPMLGVAPPGGSAKADRSEPEISFRTKIEALERRANEHSEFNIYGYLSGLLEELRTLDAKLRLGAIEQQSRLIHAKYAPLLSKVLELTAPEYYGDFVRNPRHWDNPQRMRVQVELSVLAVAREVAKDIRLLNSEKKLNFQVSVESLVGQAVDMPEADEDNAMEELLKSNEKIAADINSEIEELQLAAAIQAAELQMARELEAEVAAEADLRFKGGSKHTLEHEARQETTARPEILKSSFYGKTVTIYGPAGTSRTGALVLLSDPVSGLQKWEEFSSIYDAAEWSDKVIAEESAKHDYRCSCEHCRPEEN